MRPGSFCKALFVSAFASLFSLMAHAQAELLSRAEDAPLTIRSLNADAERPIIANDGSFVIYSSQADNVITPTGSASPQLPSFFRMYLYDRVEDQTTALVPEANGSSVALALFNNNRELIFSSSATNLTEEAGNSPRLYSLIIETGVVSEFASEPTLDNTQLLLSPDATTIVRAVENNNGGWQLDIFDRATNRSRFIAVGANAPLTLQAFSGDSNWLAFASEATNLTDDTVDGDNNFYLVDLRNDSLSLLPVNLLRRERIEALSNDGQKVLLYQLGDFPTGLFDDFPRDIRDRITPVGWIVYDRITGALEPLLIGRADTTDRFLNMSPDARFFTFAQFENINNFEGGRLVHYDRLTDRSIEVVGDGQQFLFDLTPLEPMSADGRWVVFPSHANDLIDNDYSEDEQIYLFDTTNGRYQLASSRNTGDVISTGDLPARAPSISDDGQLVAFDSRSTALINDITYLLSTNISTEFGQRWLTGNMFIHSRATGALTTPTGFLPPIPSSSHPLSGHRFGVARSWLSGNGQFAAVSLGDDFFRQSAVINLANGDITRLPGLFLDASFNSIPADSRPLDSSGRWVVYTQRLDRRNDVFLQNVENGDQTNLTAAGDAESLNAQINSAGTHVLFQSRASNLTATELTEQAFAWHVYHLESGTIELLFPQDPLRAVSSYGLRLFDDGRQVLYSSDIRATPRDPSACQIHNRATGQDTALLPQPERQCTALSASNDLQRIAFVSNQPNPEDLERRTQVYVFDRSSGRIVPALPDTPEAFSGSPAISSDGTRLAFTSNVRQLAGDSNNTQDVFAVSVDALLTTNNQIPVAISQQIQTPVNEARVTVLSGRDDDGDVLTYSIISEPDRGSLSGTPPNLVYTPEEDFSGEDAFTFILNDGIADSLPATVNIFVGTETPVIESCQPECRAPLAAVLPGSRSAVVGSTATAFATLINPATVLARDCQIELDGDLPIGFDYWATDSATNSITGPRNTPVDIPPQGSQSFVFALTPAAAFPATQLPLRFSCANTGDVVPIVRLNTFELTASEQSTADVIAIALTASGDGVAVAGTTSFGVYVVATTNVGTGSPITATPITGDFYSGETLICETDPITSECLAPPAPTVTTNQGAGSAHSYAVFVRSNSGIALDPANHRQRVEFTDETGTRRGATSVALTTSP